MVSSVGPKFQVFTQFKSQTLDQKLSKKQKDYISGLMEQVYKDMSSDERNDIRSLIDLCAKKISYEKSNHFAKKMLMKVFSPAKIQMQTAKNTYQDCLGALKRKERLLKTAELYTNKIYKEAKSSKEELLGETSSRMVNLLILDIRAYSYEGSHFSSQSKDLINHKTINVIRKAPYFDAIVHGMTHEMDARSKSDQKALKHKELISKIILQDSFEKLTALEQKKLKTLINAYGSVVNLTELAAERGKGYDAYLETLYDYEKNNFDIAFEQIRQDRSLPQIVKKYTKAITTISNTETFEKKLFESMGAKLSEVVKNFISFIQKPTRFI